MFQAALTVYAHEPGDARRPLRAAASIVAGSCAGHRQRQATHVKRSPFFRVLRPTRYSEATGRRGQSLGNSNRLVDHLPCCAARKSGGWFHQRCGYIACLPRTHGSCAALRRTRPAAAQGHACRGRARDGSPSAAGLADVGHLDAVMLHDPSVARDLLREVFRVLEGLRDRCRPRVVRGGGTSLPAWLGRRDLRSPTPALLGHRTQRDAAAAPEGFATPGRRDARFHEASTARLEGCS
jgi:hypothetical protein